MLTYDISFKLHNHLRVYKNLIIFLVVANNKTIDAPTSRGCFIFIS